MVLFPLLSPFKFFMKFEILEIILIPKNMYDEHYVWILGQGSFQVIGLFDFQMQAYIVVLTKKLAHLLSMYLVYLLLR